MKKFKEWLSDNLRYFVLAIAVIAVICILFFGYKLLGNMMTNGDGSKKQTEETKPGTENGTENKKETEKQPDTQKQTQKSETNKSTEKTTEKTTEKSTETPGESTKSSESVNGGGSTNAGAQANAQTNALTEATDAATAQTQAPQTDAPPQTEATDAPVPQTIYMNAAAYIREAPSYDGAILDTLQAGQAVTFLEDVGGWYKVEANGLVGYVGARFFN